MEVLKNGLIDDLVVEASVVRLHRIGDARYQVEASGETTFVIELWSPRTSTLGLVPRDAPPQWVLFTLTSEGNIDGFEATDCQLHLEQMDRRSYFLGLARTNDDWGLSVSSPAYVKARIVSEEAANPAL